MKLEISNKRKTGKQNCKKKKADTLDKTTFNNILLNDQWIKAEITKTIRKYLKKKMKMKTQHTKIYRTK